MLSKYTDGITQDSFRHTDRSNIVRYIDRHTYRQTQRQTYRDIQTYSMATNQICLEWPTPFVSRHFIKNLHK